MHLCLCMCCSLCLECLSLSLFSPACSSFWAVPSLLSRELSQLQEAPGCLPIVPPATWLTLFTACSTLGRTPAGAAPRVQHGTWEGGRSLGPGWPTGPGKWVGVCNPGKPGRGVHLVPNQEDALCSRNRERAVAILRGVSSCQEPIGRRGSLRGQPTAGLATDLCLWSPGDEGHLGRWARRFQP